MASFVVPNSTFLEHDELRDDDGLAWRKPTASQARRPRPRPRSMSRCLGAGQRPDGASQQRLGHRGRRNSRYSTTTAPWSTYGATTDNYNAVTNTLYRDGHSDRGRCKSGPAGCTTSLQDAAHDLGLAHARDLFRPCSARRAYQTARSSRAACSTGRPLSLPDGMNVGGLWFDAPPVWGTEPGRRTSRAMRRCPRRRGASASATRCRTIQSTLYPNKIAENLYNFPLTGRTCRPATVGLVEPGSAGHCRLDPTTPCRKA